MPFDNRSRKPAGTLGGLLVGGAAGAAGAYYLLNRGKKGAMANETPKVKKNPKAVMRPQEGRQAQVRTEPVDKRPAVTKKKKAMPKEKTQGKGEGSLYKQVYKDFPQSNDPKFSDQSPNAMTARRGVIKKMLDVAQAHDAAPAGSREKAFLKNKLNTALKGIADKYGQSGSIWTLNEGE